MFNIKEAEFLSELTQPLMKIVDKLEEVTQEVDKLRDLISDKVTKKMKEVREFEEVMEND
jgi:hypothetical protein|tara:strand:- start:38 stop:217 length:180 start_codon:yes stop_codon:yes gene_type:complete